jgi:ATP-binding protein involved in chromosome partitioning
MSDLEQRVILALSKVIDPELRLPITELEMVSNISFSENQLSVEIKLTVSHCPQVDYLETSVREVLEKEFAETKVTVSMNVMTKDELATLKLKLRGDRAPKTNPFGPGTSTRVILVGSGKGGVGKSTLTANLAVELVSQGYRVGLIDADISGFSITNQLGITSRPTRLDDLMLPPIAYGLQVVSIGMFLDGNEPVSWRGPMLHKAIEQFLTDVYWDDLDFLLLDMPPGTGDVAITVGQLLPNAQALVITTPQQAASLVAVRSGLAAKQAGHEIIGVIENMSWLEQADGSKNFLFGKGGGQSVAETLGVSLMGQIPISQALSAASDAGNPLILSETLDEAGLSLKDLAKKLAETKLPKTNRTLRVKLSS